jgi:hypothetical protein
MKNRIAKGDCLHNCYPGKMDIYNSLMLHYLQQHRSEKDIQHLQHIIRTQNLFVVNETSEFDPEATEVARQAREAGKHDHSRRW